MTANGKIRVALDTSALRGESLSGGPFEALARLAESGYVEVFIPDVAVREFSTLPTDKLAARIALSRTAKELKTNLPGSLHASIAECEALMLKAFNDSEAAAQAKLGEWMKRVDVSVLPVGPKHGERVVAKYFDGVSPFKSVKNRADFPDAFIVEAIIEIATEPLLVVVRDEGLSSGLSGHGQIQLFKSIAALLKSDEFQDEDIQSEVEILNFEKIVALLNKAPMEFGTAIEESLIEEVGGSLVRHYDQWNETVEDLYIETAGPTSDWQFGVDEAEYLGEGVISVPFSAVIDVTVDTSTGDRFHDDLYGSSEDAEVVAEGTVSVVFDDPSILHQPVGWTLKNLTANTSTSVDDVEMKLQDFQRGSSKWSEAADDD